MSLDDKILETINIFGCEIVKKEVVSISNEKEIQYFYSSECGSFFTNTLEQAVVHIIAINNGKEDYYRAAALLLGIVKHT